MSKSTKTISKDELINRIQAKTSGTKSAKVSKAEIKEILDKLLQVINETLIEGEEIRLVGYFTFKTYLKAQSQAINLQTKKKMTVPAHYVPKCKFSNELKKQIRERKVK